MSDPTWSAVERFFDKLILPHDPALAGAAESSAAAGLPAIQVAPSQGMLLHLLARIQGARSVLEIGTLGGYSTIWLARAVPADGRVLTLEIDAARAAVARENVARAGLSDRVEVREGAALETLSALAAEGAGPFDLFFIDADKAGIPHYFEWALRLARRGSVIVVDNVVRNGAVLDETGTDPDVQGVRRFAAMLAAEPRVSATVLQTVGGKGYDGLAIVLVTGEP